MFCQMSARVKNKGEMCNNYFVFCWDGGGDNYKEQITNSNIYPWSKS